MPPEMYRTWALGWVPVIVAMGLVSPENSEAPAPIEGGPLIIHAALSHTAYSRSLPDALTLKIDLAAAPNPALPQRPPLNLALVIDQSGSMAHEDKFMRAMMAARLIIENLSERDVVSVVAFNNKATVLSPAGPAVNREFLDHRLDEISPEGWTNLSAGLLEAFAQVNSLATPDQVKRVIVLTDGQANRGVTDPRGLRRIAQMGRRRGITLSTMGCGKDFDEKVLIALAEDGGGRYSYVRRPEEIAAAMAAELNGLLTVVAQNVVVEVTVPEALQITSVPGWLMEEPVDGFRFDLGDVRQGEHTVLLLRLAPRNFLVGEVATIEYRLTFDRTDLGVRQIEVAQVNAVALAETDHALIRSSADRGIVLYAGVTEAVEHAEEAILGLDEEGFHHAVELFDQQYTSARRWAIDTRDQQLLNRTFMLNHFMTELTEASESGMLHGHADARQQLAKDVQYRRYLRRHHAHSD